MYKLTKRQAKKLAYSLTASLVDACLVESGESNELFNRGIASDENMKMLEAAMKSVMCELRHKSEGLSVPPFQFKVYE
jgi:hypothetical protein